MRHRDVSSAQMLPGHGDEQRFKTVPRRRTAVAALRLLHSQHARTAQSINFILHPRRPLSSCVFTVECVRSFVVVRLTSFVVRLSSVVVRLSSFVCRRSFDVVRRSFVVVRRSSFVVRRSSFVCRRSSFVVQPFNAASTSNLDPSSGTVGCGRGGSGGVCTAWEMRCVDGRSALLVGVWSALLVCVVVFGVVAPRPDLARRA